MQVVDDAGEQAAGWNVVNARGNRAEADAVVREIQSSGGKAIAHIGDVADAKAVQAMAARKRSGC